MLPSNIAIGAILTLVLQQKTRKKRKFISKFDNFMVFFGNSISLQPKNWISCILSMFLLFNLVSVSLTLFSTSALKISSNNVWYHLRILCCWCNYRLSCYRWLRDHVHVFQWTSLRQLHGEGVGSVRRQSVRHQTGNCLQAEHFHR